MNELHCFWKISVSFYDHRSQSGLCGEAALRPNETWCIDSTGQIDLRRPTSCSQKDFAPRLHFSICTSLLMRLIGRFPFTAACTVCCHEGNREGMVFHWNSKKKSDFILCCRKTAPRLFERIMFLNNSQGLVIKKRETFIFFTHFLFIFHAELFTLHEQTCISWTP